MPQTSKRPPTASELLANSVVLKALDAAWVDSQAEDPANRHEEGGWIFMNLTTGEFTVSRAQRGQQASIDLSSPPRFDGVLVGKFHTHPNPSSEGWNPGPSAADEVVDERQGVPDLIRADNGVYFSGPEIRRGGLGGTPGYPT